MNPFNAALVFLALGATVVPGLAQNRLPRAGGTVDAVAIVEVAPAARRPRAGGPILPTDAEFAFDAAGGILDVAAEGAGGIVDLTAAGADLGLCGRKYCGAASPR